jgi:hypothetical protein
LELHPRKSNFCRPSICQETLRRATERRALKSEGKIAKTFLAVACFEGLHTCVNILFYDMMEPDSEPSCDESGQSEGIESKTCGSTGVVKRGRGRPKKCHQTLLGANVTITPSISDRPENADSLRRGSRERQPAVQTIYLPSPEQNGDQKVKKTKKADKCAAKGEDDEDGQSDSQPYNESHRKKRCKQGIEDREIGMAGGRGDGAKSESRYPVDCLLKSRLNSDGTLEYLIKW